MAVLDELAAHLVAQGVGTIGTNIFKGSGAVIPEHGDGPYISLAETGGTGSARTHNDTATERPTVQLKSRARRYEDARLMLQAAYVALGGANGLWNVTLSDVFYLSIIARQLPTDTGKDQDGRQTVTFNVDAEKEPS